MGRTSRSSVTVVNKQLETAIPEYLKGPLVIDGQTWKPPAIVASLEKEDALIAAAQQAYADWQAAARLARAQTAANNQLRLGLKSVVKETLGANNAALQAFGIIVRTRKPLDGPALVAKAQKAEATRKARGTLGRKARLAIHGVVAAPTVASGPTPAATEAGSPAPNGTTQK